MKQLLIILTFLLSGSPVWSQVLDKTNLKSYTGFFDFYYDDSEDKIYLEVDKLDSEFLYVNSLATGVGSNDLGLDRGKLGQTRILKFIKRGNKLLLVEPNQKYRANTTNQLERNSVEQAFATSVLFGFKILESKNSKHIVDLTPFLMTDIYGVANVFKSRKEGTYKLDKSKSALSLNRTKSFPKNTEFEALLTFSGNPTGKYLRQVAPNSKLISVTQHHSFVELPDDNYKPRPFDPRSGAFYISYLDYSTPVYEPIKKRFLVRHRLEKKNPNLALSEAKEPIIYYLDPGTPEPVRSALLDGARWWDAAFEAAGFKNAYQVKMLPPEADPMDCRYNVIQWVHRSTRGWSYGASVLDPRTGEIIKGHVSLGSLRIRQDFLIAQALLNKPFATDNNNNDPMLDMALARIRQLSAHEIGHTLGLAHNFAASTNNDASVMDYPHPKIKTDGTDIRITNAYDTKIGEWDKVSIAYSYSEFKDDDANQLNTILEDATKKGLHFISGADARAQSGSHIYAHLWDNGSNAVTELNRVLEVRKTAIQNFSKDNIKLNTPFSVLEDAFVPVYFFHRYQTEAAVKLIGGELYNYRIKGSSQKQPNVLESEHQREALRTYLKTITATHLAIPKNKLSLFPPRAYGYSRDREAFKSELGVSFDVLGAPDTASDFALKLLLLPERANRLVQQASLDSKQLGLDELLSILIAATFKKSHNDIYLKSVQQTINANVLKYIIKLAMSSRSKPQTKAYAEQALQDIAALTDDSAFGKHIGRHIKTYFSNPKTLEFSEPPAIPAGSPIGSHNCSYKLN